ncbi:hypothetical protein BD779DRAFT_565039 [Infundibulicybe gibba]|nr:hypothetical protein BD779DRAFT_565039 [Infundibulicybe gibba]
MFPLCLTQKFLLSSALGATSKAYRMSTGSGLVCGDIYMNPDSQTRLDGHSWDSVQSGVDFQIIKIFLLLAKSDWINSVGGASISHV